jgi:hypothetical protein
MTPNLASIRIWQAANGKPWWRPALRWRRRRALAVRFTATRESGVYRFFEFSGAGQRVMFRVKQIADIPRRQQSNVSKNRALAPDSARAMAEALFLAPATAEGVALWLLTHQKDLAHAVVPAGLRRVMNRMRNRLGRFARGDLVGRPKGRFDAYPHLPELPATKADAVADMVRYLDDVDRFPQIRAGAPGFVMHLAQRVRAEFHARPRRRRRRNFV